MILRIGALRSHMLTSIGPFQVEAEIGRGGMGVVYRARDTRLDRQVAIKALPPELAHDPERMARLRGEARTVAQLNHPHIAQIHQLLEHEGLTYLVLEYVPGRSLTERLAGAALPLEPSLRLCAQVARALKAAHEKGIIHRDLKPNNIMVTEDGVAKVLDFGIALAAGRAANPEATTVLEPRRAEPSSAGHMVGTPGYMSPEQARGLELDARADIFSFGCILYECLSGRPAYRGGSTVDVIAATLTREPDWSCLPAHLPESIRTLVRRCLAREVSERLHDIGDARILLEEALGVHPATPPVPVASADVPNNLPRALDHFIGRGRELAELSALLDDARLITLTGSGGCGKTRLAVELARRTLDRFPDGGWLAEFAATADPALVAGVVISALGMKEPPGKSLTQTLCDRLGAKRALLLLDNCEHVLEATGGLVSALLDGCRELRIVTTSREALGVRGEHPWRVPSLSLPTRAGQTAVRTTTPSTPGSTPRTHRSLAVPALLGCESVALFVDRAKVLRPSFELTEGNAESVASICRRLDGIPLAIELAAARVKVLAPEQIDRHLDDRFRLLTGGGRGAMERHRTLRAAVDWSYRMLTESEQKMLRALAVFAGGWTLESAAAVCGPGGRVIEAGQTEDLDEFEVLDLLTHLVDKSLVLVDDRGGEARYRLLETVRHYAAEELADAGETPAVRARHLAFFTGLAERAYTYTHHAKESTWLERLETEHENLLEALANAGDIDEGPVTALRLCRFLNWFWYTRGRLRTGSAATARVLAHPAARPRTAERAHALNTAGILAYEGGDPDAGHAFLSEAESIFRQLGDQRGIARTLNNLGIVAIYRREYDLARRLNEEAQTICHQLGYAAGEAATLDNLGTIAAGQAQFDRAEALHQQHLTLSERLRDPAGIALALVRLAYVARWRAEPERALGYLAQCVSCARQMGDRRLLVYALDAGALLAGTLGEGALAARWFGAVENLREETGLAREAPYQDELAEQLPRWRAMLGEPAFEQAFADGYGLGLGRALDDLERWLRVRIGSQPDV